MHTYMGVLAHCMIFFFLYVSMKHGDASGPGNYDWIEPPPRSLSNRISRTKTPTLTLQNNIPALTKLSHILFVAHVGCGGRAKVGEGESASSSSVWYFNRLFMGAWSPRVLLLLPPPPPPPHFRALFNQPPLIRLACRLTPRPPLLISRQAPSTSSPSTASTATWSTTCTRTGRTSSA